MDLPGGKMFLYFFNGNLFPQTEAFGRTVFPHAKLILFKGYIEGAKFTGIKFHEFDQNS